MTSMCLRPCPEPGEDNNQSLPTVWPPFLDDREKCGALVIFKWSEGIEGKYVFGIVVFICKECVSKLSF